jgi:hypothetical protein
MIGDIGFVLQAADEPECSKRGTKLSIDIGGGGLSLAAQTEVTAGLPEKALEDWPERG